MMSRYYDNWETLVAAVLRREEIWQLFHDHSRNTSISSISSSSSSDLIENLEPSNSEVKEATDQIQSIRRFKEPILEFNFNEILESANLDGPASEIQHEWELYESGVYMTLSTLGNGLTVYVKRVQFSGIRFDAVQAKTWWLENQTKVYESYNFRDGRSRRFKEQEAEARWSGKKWKFYKFFSESQTTRVRQSSISGPGKATSDNKKLFSKGTSEENKPFNKPNKLFRIKEPILEINFNEILEPANLEGTASISQDEWSDGYEPGKSVKWIERYESGVYLTLSALKDGTVDVERVRFSRIRFDAEQVKTWWLENQKNVYERHNVRAR